MNFLMDLAQYLDTQGVGTLATDLFVNQLPETDDGSAALLFTTGEGLRQHTDVPCYFRGIVYLSIRSRGTIAGENLATSYFNAMTLNQVTLANYTVLMSRPEALPQSFGRNDGGYVEWLLSFDVTFIQ